MQIDNNEMEKRAMELFKQGRGQEASALQDEFLAEVKRSGADHCSCPGNCKWHGKCVECVTLHRGHGDHLPHCFYKMVNERLEGLMGLTEHTGKPSNRDQ